MGGQVSDGVTPSFEVTYNETIAKLFSLILASRQLAY